MTTRIETLEAALRASFGEELVRIHVAYGELTMTVPEQHYPAVARTLRDDETLKFEQLIDLCGVDYLNFGREPWEGRRFAAVLHLLSITRNWRLRLRVFAPDDGFPVLPSVVDIWSSADWYEREAFDFYGMVFDGHPDLRRILTDYGFVGHPFRKDFPVSGTVEMRYDPEQRRVIYQPVTIEPRQNVPRVIREDGYGGIG
jgi:NADH-quinone oxidoreductase subunit C